MTVAPRFALNHMCAPSLDLAAFLDLARGLGIGAVEIRNDLSGRAILDGTAPEAVRAAAEARGLAILSINALQRFNEWTPARAAEADALIAYARACGAGALVLVPVNDGSGRANGERQANLRIALKALAPLLRQAGILGLVEPLGFAQCSLRLKSEAVEAIRSVDAEDAFHLVHDTFHHHLAGEAAIFPGRTGLVHISGVTDPMLAVDAMRDDHRVLVDRQDRLGTIDQIRALMAGGYDGPLSFEPFAPAVHALADPAAAVRASMEHIGIELGRAAA
jgi:2-keto-myo-inositol isomerase